jgi:hypothetical protein
MTGCGEHGYDSAVSIEDEEYFELLLASQAGLSSVELVPWKAHKGVESELNITNSVAQEPEGSSPHSQQPVTDPCPEPVESNQYPPSQSP